MRRRRIQGSAVRTHGMTAGVAATDFGIGCPHEALQDNGRVRRRRTPGELSAHTECQRTGEVHPGEQDWPHLRG